jgi:hypothetical protein
MRASTVARNEIPSRHDFDAGGTDGFSVELTEPACVSGCYIVANGKAMKAEFSVNPACRWQAKDRRAQIPHVTMRILALMAGGGKCADYRSLSIAEAARHLSITLEEARSRLRHPRARSRFLELVGQRSIFRPRMPPL